MDTISVEYHESVGIIRLARGIPNPINRQLIQECSAILHDWMKQNEVTGIVLTSENDKFFSIGFDIPHLFPLSKKEFAGFLSDFNQLCLDLFTFPKPTVAALTGHATAGGCILALCCDHRFIAEGRKLMGLNEIKLGVTVPYAADQILRSIVSPRAARDIVEQGEFYEPSQSCTMGLIDQVLPLEILWLITLVKRINSTLY